MKKKNSFRDKKKETNQSIMLTPESKKAFSRKRCSCCEAERDRDYFSSEQWRRGDYDRKCNDCLFEDDEE